MTPRVHLENLPMGGEAKVDCGWWGGGGGGGGGGRLARGC